MSSIHEKIAMLQRLADSTTFPAERSACLEKIAALRLKLPKDERRYEEEQPRPKPRPTQKSEKEGWIENILNNASKFQHASRREFALSIANQFITRRKLSDKQWAWAKRLSGLIDAGQFGFVDIRS